MKIMPAYALATLGLCAAPVATAQENKTEIVELGGERADSLLLRYQFDAMWAIDAQRILLRDTQRDHYLLTLTEPCEKLDMGRNVTFVPALKNRVRSSIRYEVRDAVAQPCDIGRIEQVDTTRASSLRGEMAARD